MSPFLIVAGDLAATGGMDRANLALASWLASRGREVHLVAHRADPELARRPNVTLHEVARPLGSHFAGGFLLDRTGRRWAARIRERGGRVLVNGGNCLSGDASWVHYVHASWRPRAHGALASLRRGLVHELDAAHERRALARASVVVANSERTRRDVVERLGVPEARVRRVYYGIDAGRFRPASPEERASTRTDLGWPRDKPALAFAGALGDRRKGFDTLFGAFVALARERAWDADLAVIGSGRELPRWRALAADAGLASRIHFLGFRDDVPRVLAACDALVAPARYEAYGLAVHEALACGLPAFVSREAGVAERYPADLADLLLPDPESSDELAARLRAWHADVAGFRSRVAPLARALRERTWDDMAAEIDRALESAP